jgi:hypothetical protein
LPPSARLCSRRQANEDIIYNITVYRIASLNGGFWPGVDDECVEKLKLWMTGIEK